MGFVLFCFLQKGHPGSFSSVAFTLMIQVDRSPALSNPSPSAFGNCLWVSNVQFLMPASQPGNPLPYGLGFGDNIKMSSNKHICVFCTIWPSDTYAVDRSCLGWLIWVEWCKLITQERLLWRSHVEWVCVCSSFCKGVLRAFRSSHASLEVRPCGPIPVLRNLSALQESVASLPCRWRGECCRAHHVAP